MSSTQHLSYWSGEYFWMEYEVLQIVAKFLGLQAEGSPRRFKYRGLIN